MNTYGKDQRKQQRTIGAFVKIPLDSERHSCARILRGADFAFYDLLSCEQAKDLNYIASRPILFIIAVYNHAVTSGRWRKIGKLPLEPNLERVPLKFIQDPFDSTKFSLYDNGIIRVSTREECEGLERSAVWEPEHVEERLRDHFAGRPNKIVERLKIKD